ncbi:MAG TPA: hypothetical protein VGP36_16030 [Mycobacteriales bacterium]|jgi:hypothetical protein|nr:hypothetical protein [Mycobacteriales bacterium]
MALLRYTAAAVLVLLVTGATTVAICLQVARHRALDQAEDGGQRVATRLVAPLVDHRLDHGDTASMALLDARVRSRKAGDRIQRVKVWSALGVVLYCDDPRLIGQRFPLEPEDMAVLRRGGVDSAVSHLSKSENVLDRHFGDGLEVHAGTRDADGRPIIVETYFDTGRLHADEAALIRRTVPLTVVPVALLALLLAPVVRRRATRRREPAGHPFDREPPGQEPGRG